MKVLTVVGARPQFIKAAVVSRELRKTHTEVMVHTGQHYDYAMSDIFFEELDIPKPDYNLGISGGSHGKMTGMMLVELEEVMQKEKTDAVLLYGDTNSTMAGALAAVKLHIPVVHIEAGNRLGTKSNPEEINRIVTDHVSSLHLCCTQSAKEFLRKEGIEESVFVVGDPMYDAFLYPVHPRNTKKIQEIVEKQGFHNVVCCKPVGYLMSVYLVNHAVKVVTDSGGLQREAFFAQKQCVTVFDYVVWPETMKDNRNQLASPKKEDILRKLSRQQIVREDSSFGDGESYRKIVTHITNFLKNKGEY